jgi:UDP-N-acetylglucosamine diphosphorylase/glucosamine-1-phosphate N-acetyltransferase
MDICIFEDEKYKNLNPLAFSRPVCELRIGTRTLREKMVSIFKPDRSFLLTRDYLQGVVQEQDRAVSFNMPDEPLLFINARTIADVAFAESVRTRKEVLFYAGEVLVAAQVNDGKTFAARLRSGDLSGYQTETIEPRMIEYPWHAVERTGTEIEREFPLYGSHRRSKTRAELLNGKELFVGNGVTIMPGTVIDATEGPVIIEDEVTVMANCYLKGPLFIGRRSLIKAGTRIYGATSIGNVCKIGGEVTESIFQGYTNKQHDGFIGHSYIGEWVNIGADTNNSDLKNNYKSVTVYINNEPVDSGRISVGTFMGDHSKTAINTIINTGTVIGFSVNIFGEGFPPKFIPSFSWGGKRKFMTHTLEDAIETARCVMQRRNIDMTDAYRRMMETIFEQTREMRHYGV